MLLIFMHENSVSELAWLYLVSYLLLALLLSSEKNKFVDYCGLKSCRTCNGKKPLSGLWMLTHAVDVL